MPLKIIQSNEKRENEDRWDWEVHLDGDGEELDEIEYVEYNLHETFPNPVRRIYDRESGFQLQTSGWGTFTLYIRIHYKNKKRADDYESLELSFEKASAALELA